MWTAFVIRCFLAMATIPLVLPAGWCCILLPYMASAAEAKKACCSCAKCNKKAAPGRPMPKAPDKGCPCLERIPAVPDSPQTSDDITPAFACILNDATFDLTVTVGVDRVPSDSLPHDPSPHVLHCVWQC